MEPKQFNRRILAVALLLALTLLECVYGILK